MLRFLHPQSAMGSEFKQAAFQEPAAVVAWRALGSGSSYQVSFRTTRALDSPLWPAELRIAVTVKQTSKHVNRGSSSVPVLLMLR